MAGRSAVEFPEALWLDSAHGDAHNEAGAVLDVVAAQPVMHTLAAAHAAAGNVADALAAGEAAVEIAVRLGTHALAEQIRDRLALYRKGQPYR